MSQGHVIAPIGPPGVIGVTGVSPNAMYITGDGLGGGVVGASAGALWSGGTFVGTGRDVLVYFQVTVTLTAGQAIGWWVNIDTSTEIPGRICYAGVGGTKTYSGISRVPALSAGSHALAVWYAASANFTYYNDWSSGGIGDSNRWFIWAWEV